MPDIAFQADFKVADFGPLGQIKEIFKLNSFFKKDVVDFARVLVLKMTVIRKIRAEPRGFPLEIYLSHNAVGNKGFEAVIDRCQGDRWHAVLRAQIHIICRGVVPFLQYDGENFAALFGQPQAR